MKDEDGDRAALAERVRTAVVEAALAAYEEAGMQGLCGEGRFDYAIDRARHVDLGPLLEGEPAAGRPEGNRA